mmetsp:Transcript_13639/g.20583  ORF Transcript_13639/g.20583 Transcript_13639/m.20583 type:complete len:202 (-) Transcript_13639:970-1575(-)
MRVRDMACTRHLINHHRVHTKHVRVIGVANRRHNHLIHVHVRVELKNAIRVRGPIIRRVQQSERASLIRAVAIDFAHERRVQIILHAARCNARVGANARMNRHRLNATLFVDKQLQKVRHTLHIDIVIGALFDAAHKVIPTLRRQHQARAKMIRGKRKIHLRRVHHMNRSEAVAIRVIQRQHHRVQIDGVRTVLNVKRKRG